MKNKISLSLILLSILYLSGCATALTGPAFKLTESIPSENTHIYMYWTGSSKTNQRIDFSIELNDKYITDMRYGGYFLYTGAPGDIDIESSANFTFGQMALLDMAFTFNENLKLNAKPGEKYFIRCTKTGYKGSYKLAMKVVDEKRGLYEIRSAKLLAEHVPTPDNDSN